MHRTQLLVSVVLLAACGGSNKPAPAAPSNTADGGAAVAMDEDVVAGDANPNQDELARQQAIEQARAAGVLGNGSAAPPPTPAGDPRDKPAIKAVVQGEIKRITYCYEKQLLVKPGLAGKTTATFVIATDGTVTSSTASGFDAEVDKCVAAVLQAARFAPATTPGDVTVNYPFVFNAGP